MATNQDEDAFLCNICAETYDDVEFIPRLLLCGHTFCQKCCVRLVQNTLYLRCPECKRATRAPADGISMLPKNFALLRMLERVSLKANDEVPTTSAGDADWWLDPEDVVLGGALQHDLIGDLMEARFHDGTAVRDAMARFIELPGGWDERNVKSAFKGLQQLSARCNHMVKVYGACKKLNGQLYLVTKRYKQDIAAQISPSGLSWDQVQKYALDICKAMIEIHGEGVAMRHMDPHNFKLDEFDNVLLSEYGIVASIVEKLSKRVVPISPHYIAPEAWTAGFQGNQMADVWAFGCLLLEMSTGKPTWHDLEAEDIRRQVFVLSKHPQLPQILPPIARQLLSWCFKIHPIARPTFHDIYTCLQSQRMPASTRTESTTNPHPLETGISLPADTRPGVHDVHLARHYSADQAMRQHVAKSLYVPQFMQDCPSAVQLIGHRAPVTCLAYAEGCLYSGSTDGTIKVRTCPEHRLIATIPAENGSVSSLAVAHRLLCAAEKGEVVVRNLTDRAVQCKLMIGKQTPVQGIDVIGNRLYAACDVCVHMLDLATETQVAVLEGHTGNVLALAAANLRCLVSGGEDGVVKVWNTETGLLVSDLLAHREEVTALAIRDNVLYSGGSDGIVHVWSITTYTALTNFTAHVERINAMALYNSYLLTASDAPIIKAWRLPDMQLAATLSGHRKGVKCLLLVGPTLYAGSDDHTVRAWDLSKLN
eukprot:jgi/Chlat1/3013/Chrsp201S03269